MFGEGAQEAPEDYWIGQYDLNPVMSYVRVCGKAAGAVAAAVPFLAPSRAD